MHHHHRQQVPACQNNGPWLKNALLPNTVSNKHRSDCHSSTTTIRHRSSSCGNSEKDTDISYCDFTNNDQTQNASASRQCCIESDAEQYFVNSLSRKTSASSHVAPSDLISYGSCNSLNYRSRTSLNSSCSAHHHHQHHQTARRSKCPHHHHRRKHSTSCVLLGSKRTSRSTSVQGSSSSIFEPLQNESSFSVANMVLTPSKITIEHSETGDKTFPHNVPNDPDYISSPMKWNFVCNGDGSGHKTEYIEVATQPSCSSKNDGTDRHQKASDVKTVSIWRTDNEESNAIIFHHESEIVENCCENYFSCNYQHDNGHRLMWTESNCNSFKTNNHEVPQSTERLNNTVEIASSHSAPLDILNRNNISSVINQLNLSPEFRHYEKMTNLSQQNSANLTPSRFTRINQNFNLLNQNMESSYLNEDKFINTSRNAATNQPQPHSSNELNAVQSSFHQPSSSSMLRHLELFNITTPSTAHRGKPIGINLTTQNQFPTSHNSRTLNAANNSFPSEHQSNSTLSVAQTSREITDRWQQVTDTIGLSGLARIVRKRARKCAEFIKGDKWVRLFSEKKNRISLLDFESNNFPFALVILKQRSSRQSRNHF